MKTIFYICAIFFLSSLFSCDQIFNQSNNDSIKKGDWTIKDSKQYKFPYKEISNYKLSPTLTIGSNGVMLFVQIMNKNGDTSKVKGEKIIPKLFLNSDTLEILEKPISGNLPTVLDIPYAIWYFSPIENSKSITKIQINIGAGFSEWIFSEGSLISQ
jgi:hypothetical protein